MGGDKKLAQKGLVDLRNAYTILCLLDMADHLNLGEITEARYLLKQLTKKIGELKETQLDL